MPTTKQIYLSYWKQLKDYIQDQGLDWKFPSFEGTPEMVVKIGGLHDKHKVTLTLVGPTEKYKQPSISAGFWIPDSKETFDFLKSKREEIEKELGTKSIIWDERHGRKSRWVTLRIAMDLSKEENWPVSFQWFAENAEKICAACLRHLE